MELVSVRKEKLQFNRLAEFHVFVEFPISGYNAIWTNFCTFFFGDEESLSNIRYTK